MDGVVNHGNSLAQVPSEVVVAKRAVQYCRADGSPGSIGAKRRRETIRGVRENIVVSLRTCDSDREFSKKF
jgi:hypothetical protein